ncbi:hypothetical protein [Streptomyces sp. SS]|nr:hypothetical protein [Streptomyces sp. SS]
MSTHDDDRDGPGPAAPDATTVEARLQCERRAPGHLDHAPAEGADA